MISSTLVYSIFFSDLFGAIGVPRKISRTIVVGKKADIVKKFLYVLSYFIRCSEVHENTDPQCLNFIVNEPYLDVSLSPTTSEKTLLESSGSGLGSARRTPTLSGSSGGGGRASIGGESLNLQLFQKHSCDSDSAETKLSQTSTTADLGSVNEPGPLLKTPGCQRKGTDVSSPKIILSCDNYLCGENSFSSRNGGKPSIQASCVLKSPPVSSISQQDHGEVFFGSLNGHQAPSIGMSELHNYSYVSNESMCLDKLTPSMISAIDNVPTNSSNDVIDLSDISQQVVRSQSFSGGKIRSQLKMTQLFDKDAAKNSAALNTRTSMDFQKFSMTKSQEEKGDVEELSPTFVNKVPKSPVNDLTDLSDFSEQVVRSQSFSGGKIRSRLAQQLETNTAKTSVAVNRGKSVDLQKFPSTKSQEGKECDRGADTSSSTCPVESKKDTEARPVVSRQCSLCRPTTLARHR